MSATSTRASVSKLNVSLNTDARRRVAVLVLGMHRSGTSALARTLSFLGCALPHNLMEATDGNPLGHWESDPVRWFNDELLTAAGTNWNDWLPVNPGLATSPVWRAFVERGRAILAQEFSDSSLFVLKDPRICRLVDFWLEVLAAEGIEPAVVIPVRNPLEVARSLKARNDIDEGFSLLMWLRHVLEAEASTRKVRRVVSGYEDLLFGWEELAAKLEDGLGFSWPSMSPLSAQKIDEFIRADHRHHAVIKDALGVSSSVSPWIASTYEILHRWTRSGVDPSDYSALDAIKEAFDTAAPAFARPLMVGAKRGEQAAQFEAERDAARASLTAAEAQLGDIAIGLQGVAGERDGALARLEAAGQELDALRRHLGMVEITLGQRDEELSQARAAATEAANTADAALERARQADSDRLELRAEVDRAHAGFDAAQGEIAGLREEVGLLGERDAVATQAQAWVKWLTDVHAALGAAPRWWGFLPRRWRRPRELGRLRVRGLFDAAAYLRENPDVAAGAADPLDHYILYGMAEGRGRL